MKVLIPGNLKHAENVERLYADLSQISTYGSPIAFDLRQTYWFTPQTILGLVTACRLCQRLTGHPVLLTHLHLEAHAYLARMNLFGACRGFLSADRHPGKRYERSENSERLLELAQIPGQEPENIEVVRQILRRARAILYRWTNHRSLTDSVLTILSEVGQNITHSEDFGYAVIQRYKQQGTSDSDSASEIHIAVADLGIGIEESLVRRHPELKHAFQQGSQYIEHAFRQGVSGQLGKRGIGLDRVIALVRQWHGSLFVRSGQSSVRIEHNQVMCDDALAPIPGVQVSIMVRGTTIQELST